MESGTETTAAKVGTVRRMNRNTTISTMAMVITNVNSMSLMLLRMVPVRSDSTVTSISGGIQERSSGSAARTRSTTSITLAPAVLVTVRMIAG